MPGDITEPLQEPASIQAYKEGGTFAFLIEHRGLRILVHASANFVPGMYRGVHADIVYLATGGLGAQTDAFARACGRVMRSFRAGAEHDLLLEQPGECAA